MVDHTLLIFIFFNVFTFTFAFSTVMYIQHKASEGQDKLLKALIAKNSYEYKDLVKPVSATPLKEEIVADLIPTESLSAEELIKIQNRQS